MSIYFKPTWLYIKQHTKTGLKYFGKTTKNPLRYLGSGKYWQRHLKKHGAHVNTLWCHLYFDKETLVEEALAFSTAHNISESKDWANLKSENGLDGGLTTTREQQKIIWSNPELLARHSSHLKKIYTTERKTVMSNHTSDQWRRRSQEEISRIANKTKSTKKQVGYGEVGTYIRSDSIKTKCSESAKKRCSVKLVCPHCNKEIGGGNFYRWHGNACKHKPSD